MTDIAVNPARRDTAWRRLPPVAALFAILSAACWGLGIVAAKAALAGGVPPLMLVVMQLGSSVVVLSAAMLVAARRIAWQLPVSAGAIALSGALEYGATYPLAACGLALTSAGNAAIIGAAEPALIVLAAILVLGERAGWRLITLLALVTAGLALIAVPDLAGAGAPVVGDLLVLASAATGAIYAVLSRRLVAIIAPLPLSLIQQAAGLAAMLVALGVAALCGWRPLGSGQLTATSTAITLAVVSGLLQHGAAAWLHLHALQRMPAGIFALFLALVPVFAFIAANIALGEVLRPPQLAGAALVLAATITASRLAPPAQRTPEKGIRT